MMTACSLFWWSASQQKIVFGLHWNIWWLPTVCFGVQRHNKRSYLVFTETYDDCLQSVLVVSVTTKDRVWSSLKHMMTAYSLFLMVSVSTKDRIWSSLKHMMTAYSLFWWSASQQKIVFCLHWNMMTAYSLFWWSASQQKIVFGLHWNIWRLPIVCFGDQRLNKRSYFVFTETYDDCLQSILVVSVSTKDRIVSALKHTKTAYCLLLWWASQQKIAFWLLLKRLYSDTKILSKYIPSLQKRL